jgi:hypothetical protein
MLGLEAPAVPFVLERRLSLRFAPEFGGPWLTVDAKTASEGGRRAPLGV